MKTLLAICMVAAATFVWAGENPTPAKSVATAVVGEVLETTDAAGYTYLRLKTKTGETWAAVTKASVKKGDSVSIENYTTMTNFESKSLKKTFPTILFGNLGGAAGKPVAGGILASTLTGPKKAVETENIKVPKATGANARTVEEVATKSAELKDKPVLVRGKIVKYNEGIMGKNWIHLRDGTGSAANKTDDLLVTTLSAAKAGDVVTVKGTVRTDKDFGAGYAYKVLVEDATLEK